ncbi:MAG: DNA modification methylase [Mycobacterium sp.]
MKTADWPIDKPTPYANNPRKNDAAVDKVAASIEAFGFRQPIVVDKDGVVVVGHTRLKAAQKLGMKKVPVHIAADLTPEQARAYRLADNRVAEEAEWDTDALMSEVDALLADGFDADLLGFDDGELDAMLAAEPEPDVTEDEVPEAPADPVTKPGDLWLLGEHRVLCGDSTKAEDVERVMGGGKADLCFTSPPYGAGNVAKLRDHYVRGAAKRESFYDQHEDAPDGWPKLMAGWFDAVRPVAECVICNVQMLADNKRHLVTWLADRVDDLCDVIVWDKVNAAPQMQSNVLSNAFEFCFVFGGNASRSIPFSNFHGTIQNVLRIDPRGKNDNADKHRAVFPVEFPAWFLGTLCPNAKSVIDPFLGSGTTLIAAEQLNRKCYGIEISPAYCDVIVTRWEALTGKTAKLAERETAAA